MYSINFAKHYSLVWPTHRVCEVPAPASRNILIYLPHPNIARYADTTMVTHSSVRDKNCSNISEAGHLTHWDGGKHVFYPLSLFHYQYPALWLHVSWSQLIIYWPPAPDQWEASAPALNQSERSWIWSSGLIWITGSAGGRSTGRRQTNSSHWPRSHSDQQTWGIRE